MKERSTLIIIDGDVLVYQTCFVVEREFAESGREVLDKRTPLRYYLYNMIKQTMNILGVFKYLVALSCPTKEGFRYAKYSDYKQNRENLKKPELLPLCREVLEGGFPCIQEPTLEADDVMGILATQPGTRRIMASVDKDMATVPGLWFNPNKKPYRVYIGTHSSALRAHAMQTLTGDRVDNIKGCPGIGPVKAAKLLEDVPDDKLWEKVEGVFKKKKALDEYEKSKFLTRILTWKEYKIKI